MAATTATIVPIFVLGLAIQWFMVRGLAVGGVQE